MSFSVLQTWMWIARASTRARRGTRSASTPSSTRCSCCAFQKRRSCPSWPRRRRPSASRGTRSRRSVVFFFFLRRFPCNVLKQKSIFSPVARRGAHRLLPADTGRAGTPIRAANGRRLPGRRRPAALALWQSGGSRPPRKTLQIRSLKSDWCVGLSDSKRQPHSMQHESNVSNVEPVRSAGASAQPHRNGAQEPRAARRDPRRRSGDARPGASLQVPDSFFFVVLPIDCVLEWAMLDIQFYSNVTSRDCLAI